MPNVAHMYITELTPDSYVDAYNEVTEHWETRRLSCVRKLPPSSPRPYPSTLLYKLRAHGSGLLQGGMKDYECRGVGREIDRIQQSLLDKRYPERVLLADINAKKRVVIREREREGKRRREQEDYVLEDRDSKRYAYGPPPSQDRYLTRVIPSYVPHGPRAPPSSSPPSRLGPMSRSRVNKTPALPTPSTNSNVSTSSSPPPDNNHAIIEIPHNTHPPLLRFPNDYHVCTLSARFETLDKMLSESVKSNGGITQKIAFEVRFILYQPGYLY